MSRRIRIDARFAVTGVLALIAAIIVMTLTRPSERVSVLVAGAPLPPGVALSDLPVDERLTEPIAGLITAEEMPGLADRVLLVPVEAGSPLLMSMLAPPGGPTSDVVAVTLEPGNAVQGDLRPGDRVDVYVSDDLGTRRIAESMTVADVAVGGGGLGGNEVAVLLAVDTALAEQIITAMHTGSIDLVRRGR